MRRPRAQEDLAWKGNVELQAAEFDCVHRGAISADVLLVRRARLREDFTSNEPKELASDAHDDESRFLLRRCPEKRLRSRRVRHRQRRVFDYPQGVAWSQGTASRLAGPLEL